MPKEATGPTGLPRLVLNAARARAQNRHAPLTSATRVADFADFLVLAPDQPAVRALQ
jgi:hypothetical protein